MPEWASTRDGGRHDCATGDVCYANLKKKAEKWQGLAEVVVKLH